MSSHVMRIPGDSILISADAARAIALVMRRHEEEVSRQGGKTLQPVVDIRHDLERATNSGIPGDVRKKIEESDNGISEEISVEKAAKMLGVSDRHVRNLINNQTLTGKKRRNKWMITKREVEDYMNDR